MTKKLSFFLLTSCLPFLTACGDYVETKIKLSVPQETAISNFLTTECVNKNATLFNALATNTGNWAGSDLQKTYVYQYETTNKDPAELVILKQTTSLIYIYVESTDPGTTPDRVYRYTTTDNTNHLNALKSTACGANNTFTGDANSLSYTANLKDPDATNDERIEYSSTYTVSGRRPVFFSLFNRKYNRKRYEDDKVKDTVDVSVSLKITSTSVDLTDYLTKFTQAEHCIFDTASATWLGANYPDTLALTMDTSPCATGVFDWTNDIMSQ